MKGKSHDLSQNQSQAKKGMAGKEGERSRNGNQTGTINEKLKGENNKEQEKNA